MYITHHVTICHHTLFRAHTLYVYLIWCIAIWDSLGLLRFAKGYNMIDSREEHGTGATGWGLVGPGRMRNDAPPPAAYRRHADK